ncbi:hypothetical protein JRQ81_018810 [Phrynocephalus forsythii]|uniref:Protein TOPAZ1 n=1 Tax=Phrynocephalus forsythii TaxID=171643 RepID=A0A9Q0XP79_9SAUR|nr:hypothetical protein JRQ81_018810 [Phrynocephalus forsythii]
MNSLLEPEQVTEDSVVSAMRLRKKQTHSLVNSELCKDDRNLHEKGRRSVTELKSQKVGKNLQESSCCSASEQEPQKKTWNLRKRTVSVISEQKACEDQGKKQRTKKGPSMQSVSHLKRKGQKNCKSQLQSPENCSRNPLKVEWSSVSSQSNGSLETTELSSQLDGTQRQANSSTLRWIEPQELKRKRENFTFTLTDILETVEVTEQSSPCLLKCLANREENKKFRSSVGKEMHRMVTRAFLKGKGCENDTKKLNWTPEFSVGEIPDCKKGIYGSSVVVEQAADWNDSRKQTGGKEEFLTSAEVKKESKTSRKQTLEVSNAQLGKLSETDFGISQDCSIQNLLEQSVHLPVSKSEKTDNKDSIRLSFGKGCQTNCGTASCPFTNIKCPQLSDIKVAENKSGAYQDEEAMGLSQHSGLPHRIERIPVVRLHNCSHVKSLLKPTGIKTAQKQGTLLPPSSGMGQNDSNSNSSVVEPGRSVPEESMLMGKEMCHNITNLTEYQNGKCFRESKWGMNFKKSSKRIKISKNVEKSVVQKVFTNTNIQAVTGLQLKEDPGTLGSLVLEKVECDETTCLSSLDHTPDFQEQFPRTLQKQVTNLSNSEGMREAHVVTCNTNTFEKSAVLRKRKNVLDLKSTEPQTECSNKVSDTNSQVTTSDSIVVSHAAKGKRTTIRKGASKIERVFQPYSCQRTIPISGKNVWPRESCARTSLCFYENHVADLKRGGLRDTDSSVKCGQTDLHETLTNTSKSLTDNVMDLKTEENTTSESVLCIGKVISTFDNKNKFSMEMERAKQYTSGTKIGKKSKRDSKSLRNGAKSKGNIMKEKFIDNHSSTLLCGKGKTNDQKTSIAKKELLLKTLITENISDFKIPELKDKIEPMKSKYANSSEKNVCSLQDILEDSTASVNYKGNEALSGHQLQSQQVSANNMLEEQANQLNSEVPEISFKERSTCKDAFVWTSPDSKLETSTWKDNSSSLTAGHTENQMLSTILGSEIKGEGNYSNYLAQEKGNFFTDVLKAYEDDVLVIDVIQDDPDLFGDTEEQDSTCTEEHHTENNFSPTVFSEQQAQPEPESPQLPKGRFQKLCPRENPIPDYGTMSDTNDVPFTADCRLPWKDPYLRPYPTKYIVCRKDKTGVFNLGLGFIPNGYCRTYFNTLKGCERTNCWYSHVPKPGDEKMCTEILKKYISTGEVVLLKRAVQIFTDFYKEGIRRIHLNSQVLNDLLIALLQSCLLKELFYVIHTSITIKILPTADTLLRTFEHVASMNLKEVVPELIDISYKLVDAGMVLDYEHVGFMRKLLSQLQLSSQEITAFMSRFQGAYFHKASLCDFNSTVAEFQHCKEQSDWARLGTLYVNVMRGCENAGDFKKYSLCIANILTSFMKEEKPSIPFCEFAAAVIAEEHHNKTDRTLLGRIGISVMFSYYRKQQWLKARKILDVFHDLKITFTFLKGIIGEERVVSRCHIVNVAVEIFHKCGSLDGAMWVLRESEWVINSLSWPCNSMDVLSRHNLLCTIASECITKSRHEEAFEVLQNLPGFQNYCDGVDVSQYSFLFNQLVDACLKSQHVGLPSTIIEFMMAKNIPVDFKLLRALITSLGRRQLWLKARTHYKSALALGCYPPLEGNLYHKRLLIPSYMSEVEMRLGIEIFLASNASSIHSPGSSNQMLQIVLKRCEDHSIQKEDYYQSAKQRLSQAAQISSPKLFAKPLTVNVNKEQIYSLEYASVLKWLKENMRWAGKAWLF